MGKTFQIIFSTMMRNIVLLFAIFAFTQAAADASSFKMRRNGMVPAGVKKALIAGGVAMANTIVDCIAAEVKAKGLKMLGNIPGIKLVAGKLVGKGMSMLTTKLKDAIAKGIKALVDKLRVRRRTWGFNPIKAIKNVASKAASAAKSVASKVSNAAKAAAGAAAGFAAKAAAAAKNMGAMAGKLALTLNKLTGGKLAKALKDQGCPLLTKGLQAALGAALATVGWTAGVPACVLNAVTNGCKAAIDKAFKRHMMMRRRLFA